MTPERYEAMLAVAEGVDWRFRVALVLAHETGHRIKSACFVSESEMAPFSAFRRTCSD